MIEKKSYLQRLTFHPEMMGSLVARYITNIRIVLMLAMTIALLGIVAYFQLPRRLNPEIKIPIVTVVTVLPGAGPSDVENLITVPIEDQLRSLKGIDTLTSSSMDNVSTIAIQFLSSVDRDKAKADVQSAVDSVNNLPTDAQTPKVAALDFEDQPIWTFSLVSDKSYPDLMRTANVLKNRITDLSKVDRVQVTGYDTQEIVIEADPAKLAEFGLSPFQLSNLMKTTRASYPAGIVSTGKNTYALTIDPSLETITDIRNLHFQVNGKVVALADIATVSERSKADQPISYVVTPHSSPQAGVTFYVFKTTGTNIDEAGAQVRESVTAFMKEQSGYHLITLSNTSDDMTKQFSDLLKEFRTTILLVMGVLLLFLGLRQALISSLTVPLTFLSAFFFMQVFGMSINFLSLFSFLLALGLLVDDTIVTVSAMTTYYKTGRFTPVETGVLVWKDTIVPIWSTTITTIWSFVPLLLASGIIGEFIKPIPIVVTVTMMSSTAIAVLITLPLMIVLLKPVLAHRVSVLLKILVWLIALGLIVNLTLKSPVFLLVVLSYLIFTFVTIRLLPKVRASVTKTLHWPPALHILESKIQSGFINVEPFAAWYKRTMLRILASKSSRRAVVIAVVAYALFSFALLPMGFVKNEFFPKSNENELFVQVELPAGTTLGETDQVARDVAGKLALTPYLEFETAEVGRGMSTSGFGGGAGGNNLALFSLRLVDKEKRPESSDVIAEKLRSQLANYPEGKISVLEQSGGPPAGADLQIKLLGENLTQLDEYADQISAYLRTDKNVTNIEKSVKEGTSKIVFVPDSQKLAENGLTPDAIGLTLRTFASGFTLDSIAFNPPSTDKTDIELRLANGTADLTKISELSVTTPQGQHLPLLALGSFVTKVNPTHIDREDFRRTISVTASVRPGFSVSEENTKLENFAKTLDLPEGYAWKTGGVNDENAKSVQSILQAMLLSAILILVTMVLQFQSFRQAVLVLLVIPLAVSSVFLAFALTGTPLSFPALIGVLSLFGIVVTNSMFIVDKINLNRKQGMDFNESIADAGASRMEPIILTKLCTVFGLLPITLSDPLWRGLGGAIISGLLVASTIMLLFIPVVYYEWMGEKSRK